MSKKNKAIQIVKGKLFWISDNQPPRNLSKSFYFNIDNDLTYDSFNEDFGPLNLGKTWKYVMQLQKLMNHPDYKTNQIYHYTSTAPQKVANSAYLICAFTIIVLNKTACQAFQPFQNFPLKPFRDAGYADCTYKCTLLDCLRGLEYAINLNWFNYKTFNLAEYEHYQKIENGDLNWIIPNKFIAFSSPSDKPIDKFNNRTFTPTDYVPIFKKIGVNHVIRLNNKTYESQDFTKKGIKHTELFFPDGSVPSIQIVHSFLKIAENQEGALAIHCKAGLGRTGTLIACYAMKHYYFPAADFIGWIRIARPGSILGPQQNYLIQIEKMMREESLNSPIWKQLKQKVGQFQILHRFKNIHINEKNHKNQMNSRQLEIMYNGQQGQGEGLVQAKMRKQSSNKVPISKQKQKSKSKTTSNSTYKYSPPIKK